MSDQHDTQSIEDLYPAIMVRPVPLPPPPAFLHQLGYERAVATLESVAADDDRQPRRFVALWWDRVLADHARHNGLSWPGMPTIAEEAGIKERQAYNIVRDLDLARLVKVHEGDCRSRSNHYWVRVPWVEEPECVLDLPVLDNRHFPPGVRLKGEEGKPPRSDVDYYVRVSRLKTLQPVTGFSNANEETLQPVRPFAVETLQPVTPFEPETLQPVAGEPPSLRESSSSFESPSLARALVRPWRSRNPRPPLPPPQRTVSRLRHLTSYNPRSGPHRVAVGYRQVLDRRVAGERR